MPALEFFRLKTRQEVLTLYPRFPAVGTEEVDLAEAVGRVLARDIAAAEDVPAFPRASMDGYAVQAQDTFGASRGLPQYVKITGDVAMGLVPDKSVGAGEALRLPTGGMLPKGADAVVMVEFADEHPDQTLEVRKPVAPGENVLTPGEDVRRGEVLFPAGRRLLPQDIGLLAALGVITLKVFRQPQVAVISSGDEIVPVSEKPGRAQARDANAYLTAAQVQSAGGVPTLWGIVPDRFEAMRDALAAARRSDECSDGQRAGGPTVGCDHAVATVLQPGLDVGERLTDHLDVLAGDHRSLGDRGGVARLGQARGSHLGQARHRRVDPLHPRVDRLELIRDGARDRETGDGPADGR